MAMWAGRFKKEIDSQVNDFNSSISFDAVMYRDDIAGSIAHATMLGNRALSPRKTSKSSARDWLGSWMIWIAASWSLTPTPKIFICSSKRNLPPGLGMLESVSTLLGAGTTRWLWMCGCI